MLGTVACLAFLVPAAVACLVYLIPTLAGLRRRWKIPNFVPRTSFAVLIPANNEEANLPATLRSLDVQDYAYDQFRVYVVADNCSDRTVQVAAAHGATVLERNDAERPGKGHALAFGLERLLKDKPDAVLILDADCELNREALRHFDAAFVNGANAVQGAVRSRNAEVSAAGYVAAVGAAIDAAVASGRDRFGFSVPLRGTGMAFRREVFERVPWDAFGPVEDSEYAVKLRSAKVKVSFCGGAEVACDAPAAVDALCRQRRRWRAAAGFLTSKPVVLLHLVMTLVVCGAFGIWLWPLVLVALTGCVYLRALCEIGFSWRLLGAAAVVVCRLAVLTLAGFVRTKPSQWEPA